LLPHLIFSRCARVAKSETMYNIMMNCSPAKEKNHHIISFV
jgi:hypothetical protein